MDTQIYIVKISGFSWFLLCHVKGLFGLMDWSIQVYIWLISLLEQMDQSKYSQARLIRTLLIRHFRLIQGNLKTMKVLSLMPMLNYPLNSSPLLVHHKISAYFSDELSGSNCKLFTKTISLSLKQLHTVGSDEIYKNDHNIFLYLMHLTIFF